MKETTLAHKDGEWLWGFVGGKCPVPTIIRWGLLNYTLHHKITTSFTNYKV
jgi:hypothetical protein